MESTYLTLYSVNLCPTKCVFSPVKLVYFALYLILFLPSVFFLLLSAMGLTYKILLLQSKLEIKNVWSPHSSINFRYKQGIFVYATFLYIMTSTTFILTSKKFKNFKSQKTKLGQVIIFRFSSETWTVFSLCKPLHCCRDRAMSNLYWLQTESHASVVRQLHSVLEANIHLLEEVNIHFLLLLVSYF